MSIPTISDWFSRVSRFVETNFSLSALIVVGMAVAIALGACIAAHAIWQVPMFQVANVTLGVLFTATILALFLLLAFFVAQISQREVRAAGTTFLMMLLSGLFPLSGAASLSIYAGMLRQPLEDKAYLFHSFAQLIGNVTAYLLPRNSGTRWTLEQLFLAFNNYAAASVAVLLLMILIVLVVAVLQRVSSPNR